MEFWGHPYPNGGLILEHNSQRDIVLHGKVFFVHEKGRKVSNLSAHQSCNHHHGLLISPHALSPLVGQLSHNGPPNISDEFRHRDQVPDA